MKGNYGYRAAWMELVPNRKLVRAIELYADHVRFLRWLTLGDRKTREVVMKGLWRLLEAKRIHGKTIEPEQRLDGKHDTSG